MTEYHQGAAAPGPEQQPYGYAPPASPPGAFPPAPYGSYPVAGGARPVGTIRGTGKSMFIFVITLGIYGLFWFYAVHKEMKEHSGNGLGGGIALLIYVLVGVVSPFITSSEVGELYGRAGQPKPVSGTTGLWYIPGILILVGPIIWFAKTNEALNAYWRAVGAR
jgi:hypothetical protein